MSLDDGISDATVRYTLRSDSPFTAPDRAIAGITHVIDDTGALLLKKDIGVERIIACDVKCEE